MILVAEKYSDLRAPAILEDLGKTKAMELAFDMSKEEIEQLFDGKDVNGLNIDKVMAMTTRELKEALAAKDKEIADAQANYEARGKVLENKQKQIDDMAEKLAKKQKADLALPEDEMEKAIRAELTSASMGWMSTIMVTLKDGIQKLLVEGEKTGTDHRPFLSDMLTELENKLHYLREEFVVYSGSAPEPWEDPDYYDKYETVDGQLVEKATGKVVKG